MTWTFYRRQSLKTRVTVFVLAVLVISIWALAFYASQMLRKDMERLLGEQQSSTVTIVAAQINQELIKRLQALELIAGGIDAPLLNNPAALRKRLEDRPILSILFSGGTFAAGVDGTAIADFPVVPGRVGTNYFERESIAVPLKDGKSIIGRPAMGKTLKDPVFSIAVPIRNKQGSVIGVLVGTINLGKQGFLDIIGDSRYGKTGGYLIVDPQHKLFVTATNKSLVMQPLPPPGINRVLDKRLQGFDGTEVNVSSLGEEVLTSSARVPATGWFVITTLPTQEAFAPIVSLRLQLYLAALILSLVIAVIINVALARQLAPLEAAGLRMQRMTRGEEPLATLPVTRDDEIGRLVGNFNLLVTERIRLEETLRQEIIERTRATEARARLAAIVETSSDAIISRDLDFRISSWNAAAERLFGYTAGEVIGRNISLIVPPDREEERARNRELLAMGRAVIDLETVRLAKGGRRIDVSLSQSPVHDERDVMVGVALVFRDIAERKRAESQMRLAASVFNHAAEGITITDSNNNIISVNPAFTEITGYAADEVIGRNPRLLSSGAQTPEFYAAMWAAIKTTGRWKGEIWNRRKSGESYCELLSIGAVRNEQGGVSHHCGVFVDITPQKIATDKLDRLNAELEMRVASRTLELEAANKQLESFSYSVAHDLRAPLRAINGFSSLLLQSNAGKLDYATIDHLQRIHAGSQRMGVLIDDLLNLARVSRQEVRWGAVNLSSLAADVIDFLIEGHPDRNVTVTIQPDMIVEGDTGLMHVVLQNLIGNAWKFTATTAAANIYVGTEQRNGETVNYVRDNGAGFDMQYAHKLFAPFQRLHHSNEFEGTGIGLATVMNIILRHGGKIWAESAVNRGTTMFFTLGKQT
jgi:PAS domain S-box-containing protein